MRPATLEVVCPPDSSDGRSKANSAESLDPRIQHLWMLAEVGRHRLPWAAIQPVTLPGGAGLNVAVQLVVNNGRTAKFVRCTAEPAAGALTTFKGSQDTGVQASVAINTATDFLDMLLLPGEALYAQNHGAANYVLVVFEVDLPLMWR